MQLRHRATRAGRLSTFLKNEMQMSAGLINRLKWAGRILVNGKPEHNDFAVAIGDEITALLDDELPDYPPQEGPLHILYEDEYLLAADKPAGMLIHPSHSRNTDTLANFVLGYYQKTGQSSAFHPLTRLDRDTFGIVLLAKNAHVHTLLQNTKVEKIYHALTFGGPEADTGCIDAPIARLPLPSLLRQIHPEGKTAVTEFRVLRRMDGICKLELRPITGRTHQLRLHCAHMGWPILGDPQYGSQESAKFSEGMHLEHQILCAKSLAFSHPVTGQVLFLQSDMEAML